MKPIDQTSSRFPFTGFSALIAVAALLLGASDAHARGAVAVGGGGRGFVAVRGGYGYSSGYGYGYGYPVTTTVTAAPAASQGSSLPSGYVTTLPSGAAPVVVFGKTYYFANGNYYSPIFYAGSTVYAPANP
jgi:hypothetical protein